MAHQWADWLCQLCRMGGPQHIKAGDKSSSGPSGKISYISPAVWGVPKALGESIKTTVAHNGPDSLHHPYRMGGPRGFGAGFCKICSGTQRVALAMSPLLYGGSSTHQSGGQNQKWPTSGKIGDMTFAAWEVPNTSQQGKKISSGPKVGDCYITCHMGVPNTQEWGTHLAAARKWVDWLHHPCRRGGPQCFGVGNTASNGP